MVQRISIVGAGGKMGSWFLNYFLRKPATKVLVYDVKTLSKLPANVTQCVSVASCVKDADLVLVCVPLILAPNIVKQCALKMKSGAILAEISSIKTRTYTILKQYSKKIFPLCIHPMFGPGASHIRDTRIILIPVKNQKRESKMVRTLMRGADIIVLPNAHIHDKYMAIMLGLTYYANIILANLLSTEDILYMEKIAGTFFRIQLLLIQGILSDDLGLIVSIISENTYTRKYISDFLDEADRLRNIIDARKGNEFMRDLANVKSIFQQSSDLHMSYRQLYAIFTSLKEKK
ncbi:MAG: prephenate dehydrogenase/arogenate dehydrogenase family protein [Nitrososphaeraceae archaeon]|jgi:prephenate dehydrogenase|nr:prephenate dehydrogenase/arogenate dehydrogenase family protein [Nitrososphaeraceae archaeon]MDW0332101.1 prephenate dehydrogenase/arogenate dehydrogenase family protein [Nitrososphaeraceae archaeon]